MITLDYAIQCNGATLDRKELEALNINKGYMVSLIGLESIHAIDTLSDATFTTTIESMQATAEAYAIMLQRATYIGLWADDDKLYFDISIIVEGLNNAIDFAKLNKQLAIFDNKNKEVITID